MGAATCRPCDSGCALCHTDEGGCADARLDRKRVEKLGDLTLEERFGGATASSQGARSLVDMSLWPMIHLELDVAEIQMSIFGKMLPEGTQASHTFRSGSVYSGQWAGNNRHGFGTQSWPDGAGYVGIWRNNKAEGRGSFTFPDGGVYIGEWKDNKFHGLGAYHDITRTVYRGEWRHGVRCGRGVEQSGETTYAGTFRSGVKDGSGVCAWAGGGEYAGEWRANQIRGHGMYSCNERRRRFIGQWRDSQKHGLGYYEWPDGRVYKGQYLEDQASGFGAFAWPDGQRYEGYWQDGKQHGAGRYTRHLFWFEGRPREPEGV